MSERTRIVVVPIGSEPFPCYVEGGLASFQAIVGGYIEATPVPGGDDWRLAVFVNEDGRRLGLLPNRRYQPEGWNPDVILGTCYVSRCDAEGETVDVTDADVELVRRAFALDKTSAILVVG